MFEPVLACAYHHQPTICCAFYCDCQRLLLHFFVVVSYAISCNAVLLMVVATIAITDGQLLPFFIVVSIVLCGCCSHLL